MNKKRLCKGIFFLFVSILLIGLTIAYARVGEPFWMCRRSGVPFATIIFCIFLYWICGTNMLNRDLETHHTVFSLLMTLLLGIFVYVLCPLNIAFVIKDFKCYENDNFGLISLSISCLHILLIPISLLVALFRENAISACYLQCCLPAFSYLIPGLSDSRIHPVEEIYLEPVP